jgi:hypothetical protein
VITPLVNVLGLVNTTLVVPSLQIVCEKVLGTTCGVGLTEMVKVFVGPSHVLPPLLKCGVTMIVATTGALPTLVATNEGILPEPLATRPILILLLVQV